jgi:uncharacterized GH25 family protein
MKTRVMGTVASLLLVSAVCAHDMYLLPGRFVAKPGEMLTVRLQNGDAFPQSEVSPVLERVRDVKLISAESAVNVADLRKGDKAIEADVRMPHGGAMVVARTEPHAFELKAEEFAGYIKEEGLVVAQRWRAEHREEQAPGRERYAKYAKTLLSTGSGNEVHTRPTGLLFEIVPRKSPYDLKAGEPLHVAILLRGKPAADVQVETAWARPAAQTKVEVIGRTDANGEITVPPPGAGVWRIHGVTMERCAEPAVADWESRWASLTFAIAAQ